MSASPAPSQGSTSGARRWRDAHVEDPSPRHAYSRWARDDGWRRNGRDRDDYERSSAKDGSSSRKGDRGYSTRAYDYRDEDRRRDRYRNDDRSSSRWTGRWDDKSRRGHYYDDRMVDNGWAGVHRDQRREDKHTARAHDDRSDRQNGKGKSREEEDETLREIRIMERTPEGEDDEARERRLRRLKRRRRSAGLSSDSDSDEGDRIEAIYSRRQSGRDKDSTKPSTKASTREDEHRTTKRSPNDLKRRLSAREIVEDIDRKPKEKRNNRSDRGGRSRRSSELSPVSSRRRDRSPEDLDKHDRRRRPSHNERADDEKRDDLISSPPLSQRLDKRLSRRISDAEGGIRIAGSSARRRNGQPSQRSPSPGAKLLRRRGESATEEAPPVSELTPTTSLVLPVAVNAANGKNQAQDVEMQVKSSGATQEPVAMLAPGMTASRGRPDEIYERIAQVGEGTYGQVFKAKSDRTGVIVALKRIRMEGERDGFPITAMREIKLLQGLRHENVVLLHEIMLSRHSVYMVFEYLQHDLNGVLSQGHIQFTPAHLKSLAAQLLSGLGYLHQHSILHRDLKCSNLLLNNDGTLKLADFGLARLYTKRARAPKQRSLDYTNRVVTLWYRAPELLFGETNYSDAVDVWGAGCIFLELFTRKPIFQGNDEIHQVQLLFEILGPVTPAQWPEADDLPWYDLVRPNAKSRATVTDEANDMFAQSFGSLLPLDALDVARALLSYSPHKRVSARDALAMPYFAQNVPAPLKPAALLQSVEGEWHEFESRRAKRDADVRALHAQVSRDRAVENERQQKQSSRSSTRGTNSHEHTQPTPEVRTTGRTDPMLTDQHDEGNASA